MSHQRLLGFAMAIAALGLASGCPSGTAPVPSPTPTATPEESPSPAETPSPSPTAMPTPSPSPTATVSPVPTATPSPVPTDAAAVSFKDGAFTPASVLVTSGGTVTWKNEDTEKHAVVSEEIGGTLNGGFRGTGDIEPGASRSVIFNGLGEKKYRCSYHPEETGTVTVMNEPVASPTPSPTPTPTGTPTATPTPTPTP